MPIKLENKAKYPKDWPAISQRIRERAGQRCEVCKAPNGQLIARGIESDAGTYMLEDGSVFDAETGEPRGMARGSEYDGRFVRIVLTVAHHPDPNPANCADENLHCLCQLHHNRLDAPMRARNASATRRARRVAGKAAGVLPGFE